MLIFTPQSNAPIRLFLLIFNKFKFICPIYLPQNLFQKATRTK